MNTFLTADPEQQRKKQKIADLRAQYLALYSKKFEMLHSDYETLMVLYTHLLGQQIYENFKLQVEVRALKLRLELAQAALNRNEMPQADKINKIVDKQMADYYEQVNAKAAELKAAKEATIIPEEKVDEAKRLFRMIVKRTHPDLNPDQTPQEHELFLAAQEAYKDYDTYRLQQILECIDISADRRQLNTPEESLDEVIANLQDKIEKLEFEIEILEKEFPFNMREKLDDPIWVENEQCRLRGEYEQLLKLKKIYEDRYSLFTV